MNIQHSLEKKNYQLKILLAREPLLFY